MLVAKLNYLAMDRSDIRNVASIMGSHASSGHGHAQESGAIADRANDHLDVRSDHIMAYTDSDWAANREDRRAVSGGMLVHNGELLRSWSRRQKAVSLSSWESELYAAVSTGVEALELPSGLRDFGNNTRVTIACENQGVVDHTARGCRQRGIKAG